MTTPTNTPKQETVEEAAERYSKSIFPDDHAYAAFVGFKSGFDWQRTSILALIDGEIEREKSELKKEISSLEDMTQNDLTNAKISTLQHIKKLIENGK